MLEERRIAVTTQLEPGLMIDADPTRLTQVLTNLLLNAAKYTDPGGHIALGVRRDADWLSNVRASTTWLIDY